jgi:hypothetical protein
MGEPAYSAPQSSAPARIGLAALFTLFSVLVWRFLMPRWGATARRRGVISTIPKAAQRDPIPVRIREHPQQRPSVAFEPSDWAIAPIALIYVGLLVLLVVSSFVLIAAYPTALPDVDRTLRIAPPGPRLQTAPENDLRTFRAAEEKRLNSYYWIDEQNGLVHIPISEAMKKLAASGIAGFPKQQP